MNITAVCDGRSGVRKRRGLDKKKRKTIKGKMYEIID